MSRAVFTYVSKKQLKKMSQTEIDAYSRKLELRAKIGGNVAKSAEKQLHLVSKVRTLLLSKALDGDI